MELLDLMKQRHSIRKYTGEKISTENLEKILQAGMLSATGKNKKPWEFIVVRDKVALSRCPPQGRLERKCLPVQTLRLWLLQIRKRRIPGLRTV